MGRSHSCLALVVPLMLATATAASGGLITIGTANYDSNGDGVREAYSLVLDDDNNGRSVVWLDYASPAAVWTSQSAWAMGLNGEGVLTYSLNEGIAIDWGSNLWRLPRADGLGYPRETADRCPDCPDGGIVEGLAGYYNEASTEMGHLFYSELEYMRYPEDTRPYSLTGGGYFSNLVASWYWSGTADPRYPDARWSFTTEEVPYQDSHYEWGYETALAVREVVRKTPPPETVPEPVSTLRLLGLGVVALAAWRKGGR